MINHKSSAGPNTIPSIFFISWKFVLTVPSLDLFNLFLSTVVFSTLNAHLKGSWCNYSTPNYRPICILSTILKMFESIIYKNKISPLLSPPGTIDQHGLISGKTTDKNQILFKKFILDAFVCLSNRCYLHRLINNFW